MTKLKIYDKKKPNLFTGRHFDAVFGFNYPYERDAEWKYYKTGNKLPNTQNRIK